MIGLGDKSLEQLDGYVMSETVRWAKVIKTPTWRTRSKLQS
jgi:hypothetical protein